MVLHSIAVLISSLLTTTTCERIFCILVLRSIIVSISPLLTTTSTTSEWMFCILVLLFIAISVCLSAYYQPLIPVKGSFGPLFKRHIGQSVVYHFYLEEDVLHFGPSFYRHIIQSRMYCIKVLLYISVSVIVRSESLQRPHLGLVSFFSCGLATL